MLFHSQDLGAFILRISGTLLVGGSIALLISAWGQRLELTSEHKLLLVAGAVITSTASQTWELDPLLACFAFGAVLANSSPRS